MNRSSRVASAAAFAAAVFSAVTAVVVLRRLLNSPVVESAGWKQQGAAPQDTGRISSQDAATGALPVVSAAPGATSISALPGWQQNLPVTPVPRNAVSATANDAAADPHRGS